MARPKQHWYEHGAVGWGLALGTVLAWDLLAAEDETLSEAFRRVKTHPITLLVLGMTVAHLFDVLPKRTDPLHAIHVARDYRSNRGRLVQTHHN